MVTKITVNYKNGEDQFVVVAEPGDCIDYGTIDGMFWVSDESKSKYINIDMIGTINIEGKEE